MKPSVLFSGQMRQISRRMEISTRRLIEDGMSTRLTKTHMARGLSDQYHVFARKQCITSWLPYITLCYIDIRLGYVRTATTTCSTTTGSELLCTAQARPVNFLRRGVVEDAKQSRITSSCNPQASAGLNPLF